MRSSLSDAKTRYIQELFAQEDALLAAVRAKAEALGREGMMVAPEEGKLLQLLVALHKPACIVEVGCFLGYSALWMARALPEGGVLHTIERDPEHAQLAREFIARSDVADRITLHEGTGVERLEAIAREQPQVDMVFIDADKGNYVTYLDWAEAHLAPGGLIVGDNTFLFDTVWEEQAPEGRWKQAWGVMREFNRRLADTGRYHSLLLASPEGLTVAVKR